MKELVNVEHLKFYKNKIGILLINKEASILEKTNICRITVFKNLENILEHHK